MMPLSIHTNLMAMNASRNVTTHFSALPNATRRLSSGLRVGTAADDAAGLAIRELMRADVAPNGLAAIPVKQVISYDIRHSIIPS